MKKCFKPALLYSKVCAKSCFPTLVWNKKKDTQEIFLELLMILIMK